MKDKIAYFGPKGSFTYWALEDCFGVHAPNQDRISAPTITQVFDWVREGSVNFGFVPIENSIEGSVTETVDQCFLQDNITIQQEWIMPIRLALLAKRGAGMNSLTEVWSHAQPLAQCRGYIQKNLPTVCTKDVGSTSLAAQLVSQSEAAVSVASIGHPYLAKMYGLDILADYIEDSPSNMTRFIVLGKNATRPTGKDKVSMIVWAKDRAGSLMDILGEFAKRQINLTSISSRPAKTRLGEYVFWIECEGHGQDLRIKEALDGIKRVSDKLKVLGSYPRFERKLA